MKIRYLDSNRIYHAFVAGGEAVISNQDYLNKINVFPVPDADTGTNLASTMRSIMEGSRVYQSLKETFRSIADSALLGARGNSGIIFAQFIHGLSQEINSSRQIQAQTFAKSVKKAIDYVYDSIMEPVEGTMITVMRDWVQAIETHSQKSTDFFHILHESLQVARQSLKDTPRKLKVLADAGVVDAGANGFVNFLEGIVNFMHRGNLKKLVPDLNFPEEAPAHTSFQELLSAHRYCTEAIITDCALDLPGLRQRIKDYGDSLIVAGSPEKIHLHMHTSQPQKLFETIRNYGIISQIKVDDMHRQYQVSHQRKYPIGLVTDSACDLPAELIERYQIQQIPFTINFGDNIFLDKITISGEQFYQMLETDANHPKSAQPSYKSVQNLFSFLTSHYDQILAVHISDKLTGIFNTASSLADKFTDKQIGVVNTRHLTVSQGLIVLRVAQAIEAGLSYAEIIEKVEEWIAQTRIYVDVDTLKYMVRGGRVSPMQGLIAKILNLKPIIGLDDTGKARAYGKSFSRQANMKKILALVQSRVKEGNIWNYAIVHAHNPQRAQAYADRLTTITGKAPLYIMELSPVVGVHNGIGAVGIGIMNQ